VKRANNERTFSRRENTLPKMYGQEQRQEEGSETASERIRGNQSQAGHGVEGEMQRAARGKTQHGRLGMLSSPLSRGIKVKLQEGG